MRSISLLVIITLAGLSPARAQFVVDHQPYPFGGPGSDTVFPNSQLPFLWGEVADDFAVSSSVVAKQINWWGFHFENVAPANETMRVRIYSERPVDGLPGRIVFEETFENPERIDTGRTINLGGRPIEYLYHANFGIPVTLSPGSANWLAISQIGDSQSGFRWEYSRTDINGFAYINNLVPDWSGDTPTSDLAFQLVVSEPVTASLLLLGLAFAAGRRARGRVKPRLA